MEETTTNPAPVAEPQSETSVDTPSSASSETTEQQGDVTLTTNQYGEPEITYNKPLLEEQPEQQTQSEQPEVNANAPQYSNDEFIQNAMAGTINPTMVTAEQNAMLQNYARAVQQQQQAQMQYQAQQAQLQQQAVQARRANFATLNSQAKAAALKQLNITEEKLNDADYYDDGDELKKNYQAAYNNILSDMQYQAVMQDVLANQKIQQNQQSIMEIGQFVLEEQAREPHHSEIMAKMDELADTLPYNQALAIKTVQAKLNAGQCTPADIPIIRQYYDTCKKAVYGQLNNVSYTPRRTAVPKVEGSGIPHNEVPNGGFDLSQFNGKDQAGRDAAVQAWISSQIN